MMRWVCTLAVITLMESSAQHSYDHYQSKSDEANQITCEAFEEERRANFKLDDNTTTSTPRVSKLSPYVNLDVPGAQQELRANRKIMLQAVKRSWRELELASPKLKADRLIVLEAVKQSGDALEWASPELQADYSIALVAVKREGIALTWASREIKADRQVVLEAVKQNGFVLQYAHEALKSDREVVLEAVKQNGFMLLYAHEDLKSDQEVVLEAMKKYGPAFMWASEELKAHRQVVLEAVKCYGPALAWASEELKADQEIVLAAIQRGRGSALQWASADLRSNRQVVLEAVKQGGETLQYASAVLQSDRLIVLEAVKQEGTALGFASKKLKAERQIVVEAVKQDGGALAFASEELQADRQIVLEAMKTSTDGLRHASEELRNDREIVLEAVKHNGDALQWASAELRADRQIVLQAVARHGLALCDASDELQKDRQLVLKAMKRGLCRQPLFPIIRNLPDDQEIILEAVKIHPEALQTASDRLKADRQFVLEALKVEALKHSRLFGRILIFASKTLTEDQDFLLEAVKLDPTVVAKYEGFEYLKTRQARRVAISMVNTSWDCATVTGAPADFSLLHDREIVLELAKNEVCYLPYPVLPEEYRCDPEIADLAMKKDGLFLEDACKDLRANRSLVIAAVEQNADALRNASQVLQGDWELVALAAAQGKARQFCKDNVRLYGIRAHALRALRSDGMLLQCASPELKADKESVSVAVEQSGCALQFSSQEWRSDDDFVNQTLARNGLALLYASQQLQCNSYMQHEALRSLGWDWLLSKVLNNTADHAHSSAWPKECIGALEETTNNTVTFVNSGLGLACLDALWPFVSNGSLICRDTPASSSRSFAPLLFCVVMGCFLLGLLAEAMRRRAIMRVLTQICFKDEQNQYYAVDLEGLINRSPSANLDNAYHLGNPKPS